MVNTLDPKIDCIAFLLTSKDHENLGNDHRKETTFTHNFFSGDM